MLRFVLLFAVAFGLAPLLTTDKPFVKDGLHSYIVLFSSEAPRFGLDMERLRNWVKQDLPAVDSNKVEDIYSIGNFTGFSAYLSNEGVRELRMHSHIRLIEESQIITLSPMETDTSNVNVSTGAAFTTRVDWGQMRINQRNLNLQTGPTADLYTKVTYPDGSADTTVWNWNGPTYTALPNNGQGAFVWVEDTGVNYLHQEFITNGASRVTVRQDWTGEGANTDGNGHGTHVAGSIGGNYRGVAPSVGLGSLRVLGSDGSGSTAWVVSGMNYAANNQRAGVFNILSMSLGGGASTAIDAAANSCYNAGVSVIVAAGNDNKDACNYSPARAANAITVASSTATDARSSFSNFGDCCDVFSPGSQIHSAWIGSTTAYNTISGTSMATPLVSGAVAIYATQNPGIKPDAITSAIKSYAVQGKVTNPGAGTPNYMIYSQWKST